MIPFGGADPEPICAVEKDLARKDDLEVVGVKLPAEGGRRDVAFEDGEGVPNFPPLDCGCNLAPLKDRAIACPTLAIGVPTTEASDVNLLIVRLLLFKSGCSDSSNEFTDTLSHSSSSGIQGPSGV